MGFIIIVSIVLIIITIAIHRDENRKVANGKPREILSYTIGVPLGAAGASLVVGMLSLFVILEEGRIENGDASHCTEITIEKPIASVNRGEQVSGSFFLGTGSIGSRSYYYTYIKEDKGFMLNKFQTDTTYIVEDDGTPSIMYDNYVCPKPITQWLYGGNPTMNYTERNKRLHVPPNTILREFKL